MKFYTERHSQPTTIISYPCYFALSGIKGWHSHLEQLMRSARHF